MQVMSRSWEILLSAKENLDPDPINHDVEVCSPKEMSTALKTLIYSVGQSEYIENVELQCILNK